MTEIALRYFVQESMALENINDPVTLLNDIAHHITFTKLKSLQVEDITGFARAIDPKADYVKSDKHTDQLKEILDKVNTTVAALAEEQRLNVTKNLDDQRAWLAYVSHRAFHELAPFVVSPMNGIVNRAIWLWIMGGDIDGMFSHVWYRQTLRFGGVAEVEKKQ